MTTPLARYTAADASLRSLGDAIDSLTTAARQLEDAGLPALAAATREQALRAGMELSALLRARDAAEADMTADQAVEVAS